MEFTGMTIYGVRKFKEEVDENCTIYGEIIKYGDDINLSFVVARPGANGKEKEEANKYRLGIEGEITAEIGKHASMVLIEFDTKDVTSFADYYTDEGELVKKMVCYQDKYYMFDGKSYYEVKSDAKVPSDDSKEIFVGKGSEHEFVSNIILEKEKFSNKFLQIFEQVR